MCVIDVMIPVWRPDNRLRMCVERLQRQRKAVRRIVLICSVDAGWDASEEEELFRDCETVEILKIPKECFNHGGTRRKWAEQSDAEILLFMVQDAVPADVYVTEKLADVLQDPACAVAYARHLPAFGCDSIERYKRSFHYPAKSEVRRKRPGSDRMHDCFTSDVCAAYRKDWYERLGGFEEDIPLSEDSVFAARVLEEGGAVAYCAEARVLHAHCYGYRTIWQRNFDIGAVHAMYKELYAGSSAGQMGIRLVGGTARYLLKKKEIQLMPRLLLQSALTFFAYQTGKCYRVLPGCIVYICGWDKEYWRRKDYGRKQKK